ncbi:MAG: FliA/WhiG family RNA polymerase sigma factor [Candidatus Tectomicrobia bacterium]|nr:FliA/WhiG family RNA polymerase sigma factor [Candidatus Tectomicrobia bacterium]
MAGLAQGGVSTKRRLSAQEREELIVAYAPLIKYIAHRIASRLPAHVQLNDLINSGVIGLIEAIERFDPSRDIKFKTYAEFRIRGSILDDLRAMDWVPRSVRQKAHALETAYFHLEQSLGREPSEEELAAHLALPMDELHELLGEVHGSLLVSLEDLGKGVIPGDQREPSGAAPGHDAPQPERQLDQQELQGVMAKAVDELNEKERLVITLYYYEELTMKEIGEVLGITESRVSQIHSKAMLTLRGRLRRTFD